jgi:hypothetical protein
MTWTSIEAEWAAMTRRIRTDRTDGTAPGAADNEGARAAAPAPDGAATVRPAPESADEGRLVNRR